MKRTLSFLLVALLTICVFTFVACNNDSGGDSNDNNSNQPDSVPATVTVTNVDVISPATYNSDGIERTTYSDGTHTDKTLPALIPTSNVIADGIEAYASQTTQNYDFTVNLSITAGLYGYAATANANYEGKYRYNSTTNALKFYRKTSGILLYDGEEYIFTKGDARIKVKENEDGVIKKIQLTAAEDDELTMINLPFKKILYSLEANNINNISRNTDTTTSKYRFTSTLALSADNPAIANLLDKIGKLGTAVAIKNVAFNNVQNGVRMYFNIADDGTFKDCSYQMSVYYGGAPQVLMTLKYTQTANNSDITLPNVSGYALTSEETNAAKSEINDAIDAIGETYSIDLEAVNDFDPGWNVRAIIDKYTARMYANADGFNHSFKYKAHTEEDGAESYSYTIGNVITDNKVWRISRKGTNTQTDITDTGTNAETSMAFLLAPIKLTGDNSIDCAKVVTSNGKTTYTLFMSDAFTISIEQIIANIINSNPAEEVIPVNNYCDSTNYSIKDSSFEYVVQDGILVSAKINIEIRYQPTGGDYDDGVITLKNTLEVKINDKYDDAVAYEVPNKHKTTIGRDLNGNECYIL